MSLWAAENAVLISVIYFIQVLIWFSVCQSKIVAGDTVNYPEAI